MFDWINDNRVLILFGGALSAVSFAYIAYFVSQRRLRNRVYQQIFQDREPLSGEKYFETYFPDPEVPEHIVSKLLLILYEENFIDFSRVHPDTNFIEPLSNLDLFDLYDATLRIESEFEISFEASELESVNTIRQLARCVWRKSQS